ncbi:MAG: hypothetical protein CSA32_00910 [Desulfobulbus propionicus]|nr:MAG: hypothetical protein CSA32_00910 [Desulfobulbus propionicus]
MNILVVYHSAGTFDAFAAALAENEHISLSQTDAPEQALAMIGQGGIEVVIVADKLVNQSGIDFINAMVKVNPMVNSALVSELGKDDFHEATEGLGVLMKLSSPPTREDAVVLQEKLAKIAGLLVEAKGGE